jgi:hypothetical protein
MLYFISTNQVCSQILSDAAITAGKLILNNGEIRIHPVDKYHFYQGQEKIVVTIIVQTKIPTYCHSQGFFLLYLDSLGFSQTGWIFVTD